MRYMLSLFAGALLVVGGVASGAAPAGVKVGGKIIGMPAPKGFHEISKLAPKVWSDIRGTTPAGNRLVVVFLSDADVKRVKAGKAPSRMPYMSVQVQRRTEGLNITKAQFAYVANLIRRQHKTLIKNVLAKDKDVAKSLAKTGKKISAETQKKVTLKLGSPTPRGIYLDRPQALGFAMIVPLKVNVGGRTVQKHIIAATAFVHVKSRMLYAYVFSHYTGEPALTKTQEQSKAWVNAILVANGVKSRP